MDKVTTLIADLQRQVNRMKGNAALTFELLTAALKEITEIRERVAALEAEKNTKEGKRT